MTILRQSPSGKRVAATTVPFAALGSFSAERGVVIAARENLGLYQWLDSQTLAPVGAQVVNAPGGQWQRLDGLPALEWLSQASWFVDPVNGSDIAVGNASNAAIKTLAEFRARTAGGIITAVTTVNLLGSCAEEFTWNGYVGRVGVDLARIDLTASTSTNTTLASGTITGWTSLVPATNVQNGVFVDAGAAFTSAVLGKRIRLTSGANIGATAYVSQVTSGTTLEVHGDFQQTLTAFSSTARVPLVGETYVIESQITVQGMNVFIPNSYAGAASPFAVFTARNLEVINGVAGGVNLQTASRARSTMIGCKVVGDGASAPYGQAVGCLLNVAVCDIGVVSGGGTASTSIQIGSAATYSISISGNFLARGCAVSVASNLNLTGSLGIFASPGIGLTMFSGNGGRVSCSNTAGFIRGSGNVSVGAEVRGGTIIKYPGSNIPTLTGTADVSVNGVNQTWAAAIAAGFNTVSGSGVVGT